jgi:hypothetical protein
LIARIAKIAGIKSVAQKIVDFGSALREQFMQFAIQSGFGICQEFPGDKLLP